MALPPRGDPRRPLHLAIRSTRAIGIVCLLISTCGVMPLMMSFTRMRGRGVFGPLWAVMLGALVYGVPGALFVVFSVYLGRRQYWAVMGALIVSSLLGLFLLLGFIGMLVAVLSAADVPPPVWIISGIYFLFIVAVAQLIYHLARSFEAIKHPPFGQEVRGFEPIPVMPVQPVFPQPDTPPNPFVPPVAQVPPDQADSRDTTHGPAAPER